ncbi:UNVERIFIED_CONTAM: hypothetical protein Sindi_1710700 [Sesamum indicum]
MAPEETVGTTYFNGEEVAFLTTPFSGEDVKNAVFDITEDKAPGPDGYFSGFYKAAWPVVGEQVMKAVLDFFAMGRILKQINSTIVALIPNVHSPMSVADYRPIHVAILRLNVEKSHLIISKAVQNVKEHLLVVLGFQEGHLPMRYLGLPLIFSRLSISNCQPLLTKIDTRINGWEGLALSYAGRLQIIKSVLISLSVYWASAFLLPKGVIRDIEKRLQTFLWKGTENSGYPKIAWKEICKPKEEGGPDFEILVFSIVHLCVKKLCKVTRCNRTSIWVEWLFHGRLRDTFIGTIPEHRGPWGWKKLLRLRTWIRSVVDYQIEDGRSFYLWKDPWHHPGPLIHRFPGGPACLDLHDSTMLSMVVHERQWNWPLIMDRECLEITRMLPQIYGGDNRILWKFSTGSPTTHELYRIFIPPELKVD